MKKNPYYNVLNVKINQFQIKKENHFTMWKNQNLFQLRYGNAILVDMNGLRHHIMITIHDCLMRIFTLGI